MSRDAFFSCDWGTTHCRIRLVDGSGAVAGESRSANGVAALAAEFPDPALRAARYAEILLGRTAELADRQGLNPLRCVISGMASSRIGWKELPYAGLPQPLDGSGLQTARFRLEGRPAFEVILVSGVRTAEDVMRGEEVEAIGLAGLLPSLRSAERAVLVLPGTHSKHVMLERGMMTGFSTIMTGELFAHLRSMPTLRPCLDEGPVDPDSEPFVRGAALGGSSGVMPSLFQVRSRSLLAGIPGRDGLAFLSGLLIGGELAELRKHAAPAIIAAGGPLRALYQRAAEEVGLAAEFPSGDVLDQAVVRAHERMACGV